MRSAWTGLDLNGVRDFAARDWDPDSHLMLAEPHLVDGGAAGVAIRDRDGRWIGGPQAALAPHGRGHGWGDIGHIDNRRLIVELLRGVFDKVDVNDDGRAALGAAATSLTRGATHLVLTVPDLPAIDEAVQGRILGLFSARRRSRRLLWRPVAIFLYALHIGVISREQIGQIVRILDHGWNGVEMQQLRLRESARHPGHLAPEREHYGSLLWPEIGIARLAETAGAQALHAPPELADPAYRDRLGLKLLLGEAGRERIEIMRRDNGTWFGMTTPPLDTADILPARLLPDPAGSDSCLTLFATPLTGALRDALAQRVEAASGRVVPVIHGAASIGALRAGRMIERDLPHYFDRLTPIRLAVMRDQKPIFHDLIGTHETVAANREYRSPIYRDLIWGAGMKEAEFYILKGEREIRSWIIPAPGGSAPEQNMSLELDLRQMPGQSWARVTLTSSEWPELARAPIHLDWATLTPDQRAPEEILAMLERPLPTVPVRLHEEASLELWDQRRREPGLRQLLHLKKVDASSIASVLIWRNRDPATGRRQWVVGTDGDLPPDLDAATIDRFHALLERESRLIVAQAQKRLPPPTTNHSLRIATWCNTMCGAAVQDAILDALDADLDGHAHPLLVPARARTVLIRGAGRCVADSGRLARLLRNLARREPNTDVMSAAGLALSRREDVGSALAPDLFDRMVRRTIEALSVVAADRSYKLRLMEALRTAGALMRYRKVEPFALVIGSSKLAEELDRILGRIQTGLTAQARSVPQAAVKLAILADLRKLLRGAGDPRLLTRIESVADDDADE